MQSEPVMSFSGRSGAHRDRAWQRQSVAGLAVALTVFVAACARRAPTLEAGGGAAGSGAPRGATSGTSPGEAQRERGAALWAYDCAACHGAEGESGRGGPRRVTTAPIPPEPVAVSAARLARFDRARDAFDYVRKHMPADMVGELPEREYWDVLAFVLARHGVSLGDRALDADWAASVRLGAGREAGADGRD
jgi:mono/diheme cytochrome c family protein